MKDLSEKEKMARKYCDDTGSMYFDYTDASNELIDAYESAWDHQEKKIDELARELDTKFKTPPIVFTLEERVKDLEGKIAKAVEALKLIGSDGQYINAELQLTGSPYHRMNEKEIADKVLLDLVIESTENSKE